jgi:hypothetical protein
MNQMIFLPKLDHALLEFCHSQRGCRGDRLKEGPRIVGGFPLKRLMASKREWRSTPWPHARRWFVGLLFWKHSMSTGRTKTFVFDQPERVR